MRRVVVVGGGISGLAVAYRLRQADAACEVVVLEQSPRPGGNIWTEQVDGFRIETGPNGVLDNNPATIELCRELGLGERLIAAGESARRNRFVFVGQRLHALPNGPAALLRTPLLSWRGKLALLSEPLRPRSTNRRRDESVGAFARRRLGREAAEIFMDALVTGIHGGDMDELSLAAAFPRLRWLERQHGSLLRGVLASAKARRRQAVAAGLPAPSGQVMWSFPEGLGLLVQTLAQTLGASLRTGCAVVRLDPPTPTPTPAANGQPAPTPTPATASAPASASASSAWTVHTADGQRFRADAVVLTCPAYAQAELVRPFDAELAERLAQIEYVPIAVVALGYRQADAGQTPDGFGYLAPQRSRRDVLGVQWCSTIYPHRAPDGYVLWRALCGGRHRADVLTWDDQRLVAAVRAELRLAQGVTAEPTLVRIIRWPRAIPQYVVGHGQRVAWIEQTIRHRHRGLFVGGNAYHGVAVNDCVTQAKHLAAAVLGLDSPVRG